MTVLELYQGVLIEVNKDESPDFLLEDFNYFANKGINNIINRVYNSYEVNQQRTDDLRVLKATGVVPLTKIDNGQGMMLSAYYEAFLPHDYLHLLNCIVEYAVKKTYKCYESGDIVQFGCSRLPSEAFSKTINNPFLRPSYKNPYYYISNINQSNSVPTNPQDAALKGTDVTLTSATVVKPLADKLPATVATTADVNLRKDVALAGVRYGNQSRIRLEIRCGKDDTVFLPERIYIDYLKTPQYIRLTQAQIDSTMDTSQMLEFPDYICQEIINEITKIVLENNSDQRLQTHPIISQTIADPAQQQQQAQR